MNLLYVLTTYPPSTGGAQIHQHLLAQEMCKHHQVQVITMWDENRTDWLLGTTLRAPRTAIDYEIDGVSVRRLALSADDRVRMAPHVATYYATMGRSAPRIASRYVRHLRPYASDADIVHNVRIGREPLTYAALSVAREHDIPFILTPVHHPRWQGRRYDFYARLYRSADAVLALTAAEKGALIGLGVREERITVTGIGPVLSKTADPVAFRTKHGIQGPMVLFVGQHYRYKGYRELLGGAELVWKRFPETNFVFVGPPIGSSDREFRRFQDSRIHRLGVVNLQEKTDAFAACDVFCMPSNQESFGGVYTEAWSFGKPVIGCPVPAVAEIIDDGVDGFLVEQSSPGIAERIIALLEDSNLSNSMGSAGRAKVERQFRWAVLAKQTESVYRALTSG